jgi:hypothetical protein
MQVAIANLSYLTAAVVALINSGMPFVMRAFVEYEKHETETDRKVYLAFKLTLLKFLNTSIIYVIVHREPSTWFTNGDLVNDVFGVLIFAMGAPILSLMTALALMCLQSVTICREKCNNESKITQFEANKMSELPPFDVENNISDLMNLILSCLFYAPILPFAIPLCMIGIILNYYISKFMLANMSKMPEDLDAYVTTFFADMLPWTTIALVVSYFVFAGAIYETTIERANERETSFGEL